MHAPTHMRARTHTYTHTQQPGEHEIFFDSNAGGVINVTDSATGETMQACVLKSPLFARSHKPSLCSFCTALSMLVLKSPLHARSPKPSLCSFDPPLWTQLLDKVYCSIPLSLSLVLKAISMLLSGVMYPRFCTCITPYLNSI